ncbi:FdhD protein [Methanomicrobium sp. W14]|uniref:formate dehydrogenase accessory sulfurtransferase FdhD n=1 Tax=Methanomicrobium sp. W14 TaxID=2817839 RepID=UPI001AE1CE01|nr:formate dehydrogenase accessory sulfurtransferase FdhD [Methanomicrobium sp. W14]MBP2133909.1 FdhD protein [Methanomicrobium sp. W14]
MFLENVEAHRVTGNCAEEITDPVAAEDLVTIYVNNETVSVQVASISDLRELGAGFVVSEGISDKIISSEAERNNVYVYTKEPDISGLQKDTGSSGGTEYISSPKKVSSGIKVCSEDIIHATKEIVSDVWKKTGGVHCSVLFRDGQTLCKMSDVGRHNTLDKIIGYAVLNGIETCGCYVGCTGRQPAGMVKKCANAGIPLIISKAAATVSGIKTAEKAGITLICFARGDRYTIYTNPWRVCGIDYRR